VIAALGFVCAPAFAEDRPAADTTADGFVSLFNGKDLSGWEIRDGQPNAWQAKGDSLCCAARKGSWLQTSKMYSDFVLKIEYRLGPDAEGGVGLRIPVRGNPAHAGMKVQIVNDESLGKKNPSAAEASGAVDEQAPSKLGVSKPVGEWNAFEITCRGPQVKVELNGEVVNDFLLDQVTESEGGRLPLCDRPGIGFIALEGRGASIDFRSLAVKDLTATTRSGVSYLDISVGKGPVVSHLSTVVVRYSGRLADGSKFDSTYDDDPPRPRVLALEDLIPGWQEGVPGMRAGGRRKLVIPPELAYGEKPRDKIPANSTLIYDVEVLEVR
jgi:hypothetical protein